jgi:hypothetical protein
VPSGGRKDTTIIAEHRRHLRFPAKPKSLETALAYASWITVQIGRGNLTPAEGRVMLDGLKELRELLAVRDGDAKLAEARRVLAEMKALRQP